MIRRQFIVNSDKQIEIVEKQDVSRLIKFCEERKSTEDKHERRKEEFRHYAEIPIIFVEQWMREAGITEMNQALTEIMFRKVNTEFTSFKVTEDKEVYRG